MGFALVLAVVGTPIAVTLLVQAILYARAAGARAERRDGCPFEDDDDAARSVLREAGDVVTETVALLRILLHVVSGVPRAWREPASATRRAPVLVLVPERGFGAASLALVGRRLAGVLGAATYVEPRGGAWRDPSERAERLADFVDAARALAPGAPIVLVGHGAGGLVALRCAALRTAAGRPPQVATIGTDHGGTDHGASSIPPGPAAASVVTIYSLHDAVVTPPARAYLAGAFNIAVRDVGHFGLVLSPRTADLLAESLALEGDASRSGSLAS